MPGVRGIENNKTLWVAVLAWFAASFVKVLIAFFKTRRLNLSLLISSGGMPSSHSAFVTAVTTSIGISEGFASPIFALAAILSLVVMYDASGVRRAAGKQAEVINKMVENLEDFSELLDEKLKELLGHSPLEVAAGAGLGILLAIIIR